MTQANFEEKVLTALDELKTSDEQLKAEFVQQAENRRILERVFGPGG